MTSMTIPELYDKLCQPGFQDPQVGDLFYNFFIYQYPSSEEYTIREQIEDFKRKLVRPTNNIDVLTLNLFEEFCNFLDEQKFGNNYPSYLKYIFEKEQQMPDAFIAILSQKACSEQFLRYIHERIIAHITIEDDLHRPYVFVYGIGSIYPYLRTSEFQAKYEEYNDTSRYKIILFYPGCQEGAHYKLFEVLNDQHTYRAIPLINE